jgi:hypothetical protein
VRLGIAAHGADLMTPANADTLQLLGDTDV